MATFRMRYVKAYEDRHGRMRYYYRRRGFPSVALPGKPGSVEFGKAYEAAAKGGRRKIGEDRIIPGSFSALIADYYETAQYQNLAEITKKTYRNVLERFREAFGQMPVKAMTPASLDELLEATPKNRETVRKVLRLVLKLAVRRGQIKVSPMDGLRLPRKAQQGFHPWSEGEIAAYEAHWPSGSRERLALALLLYTAQRRADVVTLGRQHVRDGKIHVVQSKTGARLGITMHRALVAELAHVAPAQLIFLQTQYGKPFSPAGFTNWFRGNVKAAGLPARCAPHGLRKAACRRLAEAGCTPSQIMAVSGHQNLSEVTLYTEAVNQERLASEAVHKAERRTKTSNPAKQVRQKSRNVQ